MGHRSPLTPFTCWLPDRRHCVRPDSCFVPVDTCLVRRLPTSIGSREVLTGIRLAIVLTIIHAWRIYYMCCTYDHRSERRPRRRRHCVGTMYRVPARMV